MYEEVKVGDKIMITKDVLGQARSSITDYTGVNGYILGVNRLDSRVTKIRIGFYHTKARIPMRSDRGDSFIILPKNEIGW